jgi:hypothetical protein
MITAENGGHLCAVIAVCERLPGVKFTVYSRLFCKKGDNPQNINFTGEIRRWLRYTYDKGFES